MKLLITDVKRNKHSRTNNTRNPELNSTITISAKIDSRDCSITILHGNSTIIFNEDVKIDVDSHLVNLLTIAIMFYFDSQITHLNQQIKTASYEDKIEFESQIKQIQLEKKYFIGIVKSTYYKSN